MAKGGGGRKRKFPKADRMPRERRNRLKMRTYSFKTQIWLLADATSEHYADLLRIAEEENDSDGILSENLSYDGKRAVIKVVNPNGGAFYTHPALLDVWTEEDDLARWTYVGTYEPDWYGPDVVNEEMLIQPINTRGA